jgi:hypothetical protein
MKVRIEANKVRLRVRDPNLFIKNSFGTQDVGRARFSQRIAGRLKDSGHWATQAWTYDIRDFGKEGALKKAERQMKIELVRAHKRGGSLVRQHTRRKRV